MEINQLNEQLKLFTKQSIDKKQERKNLDTEYEHLKSVVKKCAVISFVSLCVYTGIFSMMIHSKFYALKGIAIFLRPFVFFVFVGSFVYLLLKGYDWFINANTKYSRQMAEKFKVNSISEQLEILDGVINYLDTSIAKVEDKIYEIEVGDGENVSYKKKPSNQKDVLHSEGMLKNEKLTDSHKHDQKNKQKYNSNEQYIKNKKNKTDSIENIFNGLDDIDEDEEEMNSSEMWQNDAMKKYSRY